MKTTDRCMIEGRIYNGVDLCQVSGICHVDLAAASLIAGGADIEWLPEGYKCKECKGTGFVPHPNGEAICPVCSGR